MLRTAKRVEEELQAWFHRHSEFIVWSELLSMGRNECTSPPVVERRFKLHSSKRGLANFVIVKL